MSEASWRDELDELLKELQKDHLTNTPEEFEKISKIRTKVSDFETQEQQKLSK